MKRFFWLLLLLPAFVSCEKEDGGPGSGGSYNSDNEWIHAKMRYYYLWNDRIPAEYARTNFTLEPEAYFNSLLYNPGQRTGDRFSHIASLGSTKASGSDYVPVNPTGFSCIYYLSSDGSVMPVVAYVCKGSAAYNAGLRRGDIIRKVNGQAVVDPNLAYNAFQKGGALSVSVDRRDPGTGLVADSREISFTISDGTESDPIVLDTVYSIGGRTFGYLVYSHYAVGARNEYLSALNRTFAGFRSRGVGDLVLDLRYNPGGFVDAAVLLGSLIVDRQYLGGTFVKMEHNAAYQADLDKKGSASTLYNLLTDRELTVGGSNPNLGLKRLYVITSSVTASASELTIHCLKAYIPVTVVGKTTVGKNLASISLTSPDDTWRMSPIVGRVHDRNGVSGYENGLAPDLAAEEGFIDAPLGDTEHEPLLNLTLAYALGLVRSAQPVRAAEAYKRLDMPQDFGIRLSEKE